MYGTILKSRSRNTHQSKAQPFIKIPEWQEILLITIITEVKTTFQCCVSYLNIFQIPISTAAGFDTELLLVEYEIEIFNFVNWDPTKNKKSRVRK